jgi:hypothetical protein
MDLFFYTLKSPCGRRMIHSMVITSRAAATRAPEENFQKALPPPTLVKMSS